MRRLRRDPGYAGTALLAIAKRQVDTAILSHGFWQRRFAGIPGVLGRTVRIDLTPYTVIGLATRSRTPHYG